MKTNNNVVGGQLSTSQYNAYADYLNSFVTYLKNGGVSLYAISVQVSDFQIYYNAQLQYLSFKKCYIFKIKMILFLNSS